MGDLLFGFTEWIRTTQLVELALWISDTGLSMWIVTHFWAIPIFQVTHILAIAASFSSILMMNARLFGIAGSSSIAETTARYTKVLWWALLVLVISGFFMIAGEPVRELINPIFWIKMGLFVVAILFSIWWHRGVVRRGETVGGGTKLAAVFFVVLWCLIMLCGRWIAYAPV
jgi:hypothetical protein